MIELLITLIALLAIGFMLGGFISLLVAGIAFIAGYFTNTYVAMAIVFLVFVGGGIYKYKSKKQVN